MPFVQEQIRFPLSAIRSSPPPEAVNLKVAEWHRLQPGNRSGGHPILKLTVKSDKPTVGIKMNF